jgi:glutathione S-transferase
MKLWHCADARSLRALWALEELELDYELVVMPFPPRFLHREFLEKNPLGTIPYFEDGDARMTESAAICQYLGDRYDPERRISVAPDDAAYGSYLNWLHQSDATLTFPQTLVLRYTRLEPEERRQPTVAKDYARWFIARLRMADACLAEHEYLVDDRFTMADVAVAYALYLGRTLELDADYQPQTRAYLDRMIERPAFQRAQAQQQRPELQV